MRPYRTGHTLYVDYVKNCFRPGFRWLDAGGGAAIFHDLYDGERDLVAQARTVVAADYDLPSLKRHVSVSTRISCDLARLPLKSSSFDMVTCSMVVEHLRDPANTFHELSRVLDRGGRLIVHTVNLWGYPTILGICSRLVPFGLRRRMISRITAREEDDIFPTLFRCNTRGRLTKIFSDAGLSVEFVEYLPAGRLFRAIPILRTLEEFVIRALTWAWLRPLRPQLLAVAFKEAAGK